MNYLIKKRKLKPKAPPKIIRPFVEDEKTEIASEGILVWPNKAYELEMDSEKQSFRQVEFSNYEDGWFNVLGNLILSNNQVLIAHLENVGNLGLEWRYPKFAIAYWANEAEVGEYGLAHLGAPLSRIWQQIANYQSAFHELYVRENIDSHDRDSALRTTQFYINEHCRIGYSPEISDSTWSIQPYGALGAAWLQLANSAAGETKHAICALPGCGKLYIVSKSRGHPRRYCSKPCKSQAYRDKQKKA